MSRFLIAFAVVAVLCAATAANAYITTYTGSSLTLKPGQVPVVCSTASRRVCYKGFWGAYLYTCDTVNNRVELSKCASSDIHCHGTCNFRNSFTVGRPTFNNYEFRNYNFTGTFASVSQVVARSKFSTTPCVRSSLSHVHHFPLESTVCLPGHFRGESEKWYASGTSTVHAIYRNTLCSSANSGLKSIITHSNHTCVQNNRYMYDVHNSAHTAAILWRASAGAIASAVVGALLVVMALLL